MNELQVIKEQEVLGKDFKVYGSVDEPLFLAKDVAEWIDYSFKDSRKVNRDVSKMLKTVDDDEKIKCTLNLGGEDYSHGGIRKNTEMWFLTENGLYEVLMQSRKPIAKQFKKEVKKILKQIRQTGGYIPFSQEESNEEILARALIIAKNTLDKKNKLIEEMQPKVNYHDKVLNGDKLVTTTDIAKDLGMTARQLHNKLHDMKIIFKTGNHWTFYAKYQTRIPLYADYQIGEHGQILKWTEKGRKWIIKLLNEQNEKDKKKENN